MITEQEHLSLAEGKMDASWERYHAGRVDLVDRYDVTVALVKGPKVLDVGCGQALLGYLLWRRNPSLCIISVDISPNELDSAFEHFLKTQCLVSVVGLQQMDAENLILPDSVFNTVVMGQTLEHVRYPDRAADEALRVLKSGGRLIVNVPNDDERPHGNHLHVYRKVGDMLDLFGDAINWQGKGEMHNFWFAWGEKK